MNRGTHIGAASSDQRSCQPLENAPAGRVILTQVNPSSSLISRLQANSWETYSWPALALTPVLTAAVPQLETFDLVVFVSGNAARFFKQQLEADHRPTWPIHVPVATVGLSSAAAVREAFGQTVQVIHPPADSSAFDSEALWSQLQPLLPRLRSVLIVRGGVGPEGQGRGWLKQQFEQAGVRVHMHVTYRREAAIWPQQYLRELNCWVEMRQAPVWVFASGEGVAAVAGQLSQLRKPLWEGSRVVVFHPRIGDAVISAVEVAGLATRAHYIIDPAEAGAESSGVVIQVCLPHEDAVLAAIVH